MISSESTDALQMSEHSRDHAWDTGNALEENKSSNPFFFGHDVVEGRDLR